MSEQGESAVEAAPVVVESTDFGARAAKHLREDVVVWLTTVSPKGAPSPNPVWFVWDGAATVRMFSMASADRIRHLENNSRVTLNFAGDGQGGDVVVLIGTAVIDEQAPGADAVPEYVSKYGERISGMNLTPASFAHQYGVPVVITLDRLRGH